MKDVEFYSVPERVEQDEPRKDISETIRSISQKEIICSGGCSIRPKGEIIYRLKAKQEDRDFYSYLSETLGVDYQEIYEDALKFTIRVKE